ncbi:hypothetical protein BJ165DRAFT_1484244, partial [Panaeolus papilionaceus]
RKRRRGSDDLYLSRSPKLNHPHSTPNQHQWQNPHPNRYPKRIPPAFSSLT